MPKSYAPEFRRRVADLCRSGGRRPRNVAEEFDVSEATVYRWIAQDEVDPGKRSGVRSGECAELSEARARIRELEVELELTRKAAAIFEEQEGQRAVPPKRIYPVIETLAGQGHAAKACCRLLGVAPSGYFYWRTRPPLGTARRPCR
jgi:transposase